VGPAGQRREGRKSSLGLALKKENGPAAGPCEERRGEKRRARERKWARGEKKGERGFWAGLRGNGLLSSIPFPFLFLYSNHSNKAI
jgi:hypothetical protein